MTLRRPPPHHGAGPIGLAAAALFTLAGCAAPPCPHPATPPPASVAAGTAVPVFLPAAAPASEAGAPNPGALRALPDLPRPSPNAEVKQAVGITEVHVAYSSPGAKGRSVWGTLVPYGELWRAGANAPTKLTVSRDFTFGGQAVPAGRYSLFIKPTESAWTVILNRDPKNAGSSEHDATLDVASVEVQSTASPPRERLVFMFDDTTDESTTLVLDWAGRRMAVPITVNTKEHVDKSIADTLDNAWRPLFNAGRYAFDAGDNARALELLTQSIGVRATWWNHWWAAQALAKDNQHKAAREHANKAVTLGENDSVFKRAFAEQVKKALDTWPQG